MTSARLLKRGAWAVAAALVMLAGAGCVRIEFGLQYGADGSTDAVMEVAVRSDLGEGTQEASPAEEAKQGLAEGLWTFDETKEVQGWRVDRMRGHAGPGQSLFVENEETAPIREAISKALTREERLFTTEYHLALSSEFFERAAPLAAPPGEGEAAPAEAGAEGQAEGGPQLVPPEALNRMLMQSITFTVRLGAPGRVVETNGAISDDGGAVWRMDAGELTEFAKAGKAFEVSSRAIHWQAVGRLADDLAAGGHGDWSPEYLADLVSSGWLPNPPVQDQAAAPMDTKLYADLVVVVTRLSEVLRGPALVGALKALGMMDEAVDSAKAAALADKLRDAGEDTARRVGEAAAQALQAGR